MEKLATELKFKARVDWTAASQLKGRVKELLYPLKIPIVPSNIKAHSYRSRFSIKINSRRSDVKPVTVITDYTTEHGNILE